jgi:hypothetical protein
MGVTVTYTSGDGIYIVRLGCSFPSVYVTLRGSANFYKKFTPYLESAIAAATEQFVSNKTSYIYSARMVIYAKKPTNENIQALHETNVEIELDNYHTGDVMVLLYAEAKKLFNKPTLTITDN